MSDFVIRAAVDAGQVDEVIRVADRDSGLVEIKATSGRNLDKHVPNRMRRRLNVRDERPSSTGERVDGLPSTPTVSYSRRCRRSPSGSARPARASSVLTSGTIRRYSSTWATPRRSTACES